MTSKTPLESPSNPAQRSKPAKKPVALVIGAGDATGGAVAERFAQGGYAVCATRRSVDKLNPLVARVQDAGGEIHAFGSDAREEAQVVALVEHIEQTIGPIEVLVFNIGANSPMSILDETAQRVSKLWQMGCLAGFLNGREVAKRMAARATADAPHVGTIIFTGATASLRGSAGFAGFAIAKHGLRALAQAMARELGPKGIHVAHSIIDGAIDTDFIKTQFPQRYALKAVDGILNPAHIAQQYWQLHQQPRDAWTFELDLRPYMEKF
jgi:NAD(P)-dependent dehydrogenase (short-subunit alcohol dehydrogenase family)